MITPLESLIDLLKVQDLGGDRYLGESRDLGWGRLYGGHVMSQALVAAFETVSPNLYVHSLHAYFLRPGGVVSPIEYEVDRIRDGRSFVTRRVVARQDGKAIFNLSASFHGAEEGVSHQTSMPDVPAPETLKSERALALELAEKLPRKLRDGATRQRPIETRPTHPSDPFNPEKRPPERCVWYRASGSVPDDHRLHQSLLAYVSDFNLLGTAIQPHGISYMTPGVKMASLDHAMWFHRPFSMNDWLLYSVESPVASGARALARGQVFSHDGQLVASTVQEGVVRVPQT